MHEYGSNLNPGLSLCLNTSPLIYRCKNYTLWVKQKLIGRVESVV